MQDAIVLANWIAALPSLAVTDMEKIFKEYKKERYSVAMEAYNNGRMLSKVPGAVSFMLITLCVPCSLILRTNQKKN